MLPWFCSTRCATIRTMKPTVCCNRNLQFPLGCQVCWVPPDVLNVRAQALLCSRSWNCCLETLSLGLLVFFLLSSCSFLSLLSLFCRRLWIYHSSACQILLLFQRQNNSSVYRLVQLVLCSKNLIQLYQVSASLVSLEFVKFFLSFCPALTLLSIGGCLDEGWLFGDGFCNY